MDTYVRAVAKGLFGLVALVVLHACGGGGGDDGGGSPPPAPPAPPAAVAPSALSYTSPQTYTVGTAITPLSPTVTGTVTSYAVSPALPAGVAIDATTGAVSGTPTQAAAAADYTITASNASGSTTFALNVTVNDVPAAAPPSGLSYTSPQTYTVGTAITALTPTVTGTVSSYAVSPALPAGLAIDATTGAISGTPTAVAAQAVYTITASNAAGSTTFNLTLAALLERATADRPDKAGKENTDQIHVLYVVPSDAGYDQQLDTTGKLEASVRSWNNWFGKQTGGPKLRLDTYGDGDRLDVTFVQLTKSDADLANTAGNVRTKLEFQLLAMGFNATNKVYLAYYEGDGDGCGSGAWPPALHGMVSALYLRGKANPDCPAATFVGENDDPGYWEFRGVHEVLHPLGFAPACAPHQVGGGHVTDSTRDLLYSNTAPATQPTTLDVNHDDYFTAAVPGCFDLMNSAYLDPAPAGPEEPPQHPYVNLTSADCATELSVVPAPNATDATITFVNAYAPGGAGAALSVSELVVSGSGNVRTNVNSLPFGDGLTLNSATNTKPKVGTVYVVTVGGIGGQCQAIVTATANPGRFVVKATP